MSIKFPFHIALELSMDTFVVHYLIVKDISEGNYWQPVYLFRIHTYIRFITLAAIAMCSIKEAKTQCGI